MRNEYFEIVGGNPLFGKTKVYSAKNAVLPMLAGAMLTSESVVIKDCPHISDVENMVKIWYYILNNLLRSWFRG